MRDRVRRYLEERGCAIAAEEIVSRWFSANRRYFNFVDVDEAGSYEATLSRLRAYLADPDRLSRKVYYR
jgi:hypothetical protein